MPDIVREGHWSALTVLSPITLSSFFCLSFFCFLCVCIYTFGGVYVNNNNNNNNNHYCIKLIAANPSGFVRPHYYKCKNNFNEMKGDVEMSLHEKEGNKKNLHQADNPSLHLCFKKWFALFGIGSERQDLLQNNCMLFLQEQRNKK